MIVYLITNIINNKQYVGQSTRSLEKRWSEHCCQGTTARSAIKSAIKKYGKENFTIAIIDQANNINDLNKKESFWIKELDSFGNGYNLTSGGDNHEISDITRQKMSIIQKGRIKSKEEIAKIVKANTGSKRSNKTKLKMSISAKKDLNRLDHLKSISPRRKIKDQNNNIYTSIKEAAKITGVGRGSIYKVLKGEWKQVKGYIFKYEVNNEY